MKTTERDEVKSLRFLEPLQAVGHIAIVIGLRGCNGPAHRDKAAMNGAQLPERLASTNRIHERAAWRSPTAHSSSSDQAICIEMISFGIQTGDLCVSRPFGNNARN
jgi:hypothetical protein